jgi:hypothetical protein
MSNVLALTTYEAYGESVGWKDYLGKPMHAWEELPWDIQQAWTDAAEAVAVLVVE